jgi:hypothetical protein
MPTIILQGDWWDALSTNGQVSDGMSLMACTGLAHASQPLYGSLNPSKE